MLLISTHSKDHHSRDAHNCINDNNIVDKTSNEHESIHGRCCFCKTSVPDIELVFCVGCHLKHCLIHRHPDSHKCNESFVVKESSLREKAKPALKCEAPNVRGAKNEALARRVAVMKLKQTATGLTSTPETERLYFKISVLKDSEKTQSKSIFLCKKWSVGKCVDWLASNFHLVNNNNNPSAAKLVLCLDDDENIEPFSLSVTLNELETNDTICNGSNLLLKYINNE